MSYLTAVVRRAEQLGLPIPLGLIKFLMVGVVGLAVDLGTFSLLERMGVPFQIARLISIPLATLVTWALNRRHTFAATGRKAHHEALRYMAVTLVAQSVNYGAMIGAVAIFHALPHIIAAFSGAVLATAFSYTGQRFFTFAPEKPKPAPALDQA